MHYSPRYARVLHVLFFGLLLLLFLSVGRAADLYWDPLLGGTNFGGSGTWSSTTNVWWNGTTDTTLNNSTDVAFFTNTAGTVTMLGVQANGLVFASSGFTLVGANSDLTLNAGGITINAGVTGTVITNIRRILLNTATFTRTDLATFTNAAIVINGSGKTLTVSNSAADATTVFGNFAATQSAGNGSVANTINGSGNVQIAGSLGAAGNFGTPIALNSVGGSSLTYAGTGTLTLSGNNVFFYNTNASGTMSLKLTSGTLALGNNNALGAYSDSNNTVATTTFLELNGGTVLGTASRTIANSIKLAASSGVGGSNAMTFSGAFTNSGGNFALTNNNTAATTLSGSVYLSESETSRTMTVAGTGNTTISGVIANNNAGNTVASGLTKTGAGTLTLSGTNTYTGITTVGGGTLNVSSMANGGTSSAIGASANAAANLVLSNAGVLRYTGATVTSDRSFTVGSGGGTMAVSASDAKLTMAGASVGGNTLTKSGAGTLEFTAAVSGSSGARLRVTEGVVTLGGSTDNAFLGATIDGGTLVLAKASSGSVHATGGTTILNGGTLQLGGTGGDQLWNSAALTFAGGTFDLNGLSEAVGAISSTGGTISSGVAGGVLTSSSGLTHTAGTLTVSSGATFSGPTVVSGGSLVVAGSINGAVTNNSALIFSNSENSTHSATVSGTGGVTKSGNGTLALSGTNTYSGGTTINAGVLSLGSAGAIGSSGTIGLGGGTLQYTASNTTDYSSRFSTASNQAYNIDTGANAVTFATALTSSGGTLTKTGAGTLTLAGTNTYNGGTLVSAGLLSGSTVSLQGNITNNAAVVFDQSGNGTYAGVLSGTGTLLKTNSGMVTLAGANTQSGGTLIAGGTLQIGSGGTTGSLAGAITNNAALVFNRSDSLTQATVISGTGSVTKSGAGTLTLSGANTYSGATTVNGGALVFVNNRAGETNSFTLANGSTLEFNLTNNQSISGGTISGTGTLVKSSAGTLNLGTSGRAANIALDASSLIHVQGGTLKNDWFNAGWSNNLANLTVESGATFDVWDGAARVGVLSGAGLIKASGATNTLTIGVNNGSGTFDGAVSTLTLLKTGTGSQTLTGTVGGTVKLTDGSVTLSGATDNVGLLGTLDAGTLILAKASSASVHALGGAVTLNGGTLKLGGTGGDQIYNPSTVTFAGGTFDLNGLSEVVGAISSMGGTISSGAAGGVLTSSSGLAHSAGTLTIQSGATFTGPALVSGGSLVVAGAVNGAVTNNSALIFSSTGNQTQSSAISGTGYLTKNGSGTLILAGTNNYSGGTLVSAGVLQGNTTGLQGSITNNASVVFDQSGAGTYAGNMSGSGSLTKIGSGTVILAGANTYGGSTLISAGTLQIGNGGTSGSIASTSGVTNNGTLAYNRSDNLTASYAISGTGNLTKSGNGTLTLSGSNSYAGGTLLDGGKLVAGNASAFGTGSIAIGSGTYLDLSTYTILNALTNSGGTILSSGTLENVTADSGTTDLGGNNSSVSAISGSATVNVTGSGTTVNAMSGGTLNVNGASTVLTNYSGGNIGISNSRTLTINAGNSSGSISGAGGLTKSSSGTLTLSANNTYTGATTVEAGKLVVNGTNTSATTVQNSASLGGGGTLASATIQSGGTITPGNSPGTLTITSGLTWNAGGNYDWEIFGVAGTAGQTNTWDWINITGGGLDISGLSTTNKFNINLISLLELPSTHGALASFDNTQSYSWKILSSSNGLAGFNADYFAINDSEFTTYNNVAGGTFELAAIGNDMFMLFNPYGPSPVPEPGTWAAAALIVLGATFIRHRRARDLEAWQKTGFKKCGV